MGARTPVYKIKIWSTRYADARFSKEIRSRDPICKRCTRRASSDNSHFWRRGHSGTRFDFDNCDGVCRPCHDIWEHQKNTEYREWKIEQLGKEKYEALEIRARTFKKRIDAVLDFMKAIKDDKI